MTAYWSKADRTVNLPGVVYVTLCVVVFLTGVLMLRSAFGNALIVAGLEILFITVYFSCLWVPNKHYKSVKLDSWVWIAVVIWAICVSISLVFSPYDLLDEPTAIYRYEQTLLHVLTFVFVRDLLSRYEMSGEWILLTISLSGIAVGLGMFAIWLNLDTPDGEIGSLWFWNPPFNSHIRHTGYQIAAGVSLLAPFFLSTRDGLLRRIARICLFVGLAAFLFWMGGRGSIIGVYGAFGCLAVALWIGRVQSWRMWLSVFFYSIAAILLAEALVVFDWNGIFDLIGRTATASDLNQMSTGRSRLWYSSWVSVREHPFFGLGPQGYFFMPNRILPNTIVTVQPHSFLVQFVVEWGFIGAALFSALLLYGFYRGFATNILHMKGRVSVARLSAGTMIVALTIHGVFDGTFYHPQPSLYLAIGFAIWTQRPRAVPEQRDSSEARPNPL